MMSVCFLRVSALSLVLGLRPPSIGPGCAVVPLSHRNCLRDRDAIERCFAVKRELDAGRAALKRERAERAGPDGGPSDLVDLVSDEERPDLPGCARVEAVAAGLAFGRDAGS